MESFVEADGNGSSSFTSGHDSFHRLPEEVWLGVVSHLSAVDVLSLLCVNRRLSTGLGRSSNLWKMLSSRDGRTCYEINDQCITNSKIARGEDEHKQHKQHYDVDTTAIVASWRTEKESYLFHCLKSDPSETGGGVRWHPVHPYGNMVEMSSSTRQLSCVLKRRALNHDGTGVPPKERIIVINGRFLMENDTLYIHAGTAASSDEAKPECNGDSPGTNNTNDHRRKPPPRWHTKLIIPQKPLPPTAYGASLTALPTIYSETTTDSSSGDQSYTTTMRALRFGGARSDRHASETSRCVLMTVTQTSNRKRKTRRRQKRDKQNAWTLGSYELWQWKDDVAIRWKTIPTTGIPPADAREDQAEDGEQASLARSYHTATLLLNRYLVVIGGMKSRFSILDEAVLDTHTWRWIGNGSIACGSDEINSRPSGRHGHSVIFDDARNRLVLFGGGSGLDLFRSGEDNSEVWELQLGNRWKENNNETFEESFPWRWKKLHDDSNGMIADDEIYKDTTDGITRLSPADSLCLGRCHHGIKISRDTALFVFGSGRPSTNGLLAYNLKTDTFLQKQRAVRVQGIVPQPRFAGVAAFLEEDGYIITHGGYCGPSSTTGIGTMDVLDLVPHIRTKESRLFDGLGIDEKRVSFPKVTDSEARLMRHEPDAALQRMLRHVMSLPVPERQPTANVLLNEMRRGRRPSNEQSLLVMSVIASCNPNWLGDGDEEVEEDDSFAELYRELEEN